MKDENLRLKIALQKSGKLFEGSLDLLNKCNFNLHIQKNHLLIKTDELNTDFLMIRDDDIPGFVDLGAADVGIVGENLFVEYALTHPKHNLEIISNLKFAYCRLSLAANNNSKIKKLSDLSGCTIATSYPHTLSNFLAENKMKANVIVMHGSVELAPKIGVADVICDLVSSGATLKENDLNEFHVILESHAVLIGKKGLETSLKERVSELNFRFQSVIQAKGSKYIMLHIDKQHVSKLSSVFPGCETPTVLSLQGEDSKVAVHVVSKEDVFWDTIARLKKIGATSILVTPIEKMML